MNKQVKIGIIVVVLILAATVVGFYVFGDIDKDGNFANEVERNIAAEDRKIFEDRINEYKGKIEAETDTSKKYNLYIQLGFTQYTLGHLKDSKDSFNKAVAINADQYDVYVGLFQTQSDMGDYAGAEKSIKKAISIRKGIADLWKRYIQFKIDRLKSPESDISSVFADAENDIRTYGDIPQLTDIITYHARWLDESVGNSPASIEYWKKAIELNPEDKDIYNKEIKRLEAIIQRGQ